MPRSKFTSPVLSDQRLVLEVLREHGPLADDQLIGFFPLNGRQKPQTARRRRQELARNGHVVFAGYVKSITGRRMKAWRVV